MDFDAVLAGNRISEAQFGDSESCVCISVDLSGVECISSIRFFAEFLPLREFDIERTPLRCECLFSFPSRRLR